MALVTFVPARLAGHALVPPSKSEAHRALLLAAFGDHTCRLTGFPPPLCRDTLAMINGITALGASVHHENTVLVVQPIPKDHPVQPMADCCVHACAAALRMLIPAFLVRGQAVRFRMEEGLFNRPLDAFEPLMRKLGAQMKRIPPDVVEITGHIPAGNYEIDGTQSSQFASGMLMALSQAAPSTLRVTGPIASRPYLDMTLRMMERFSAPAAEEKEGVFVLAPRLQSAPEEVSVSGDWTQAAVFLCMNAMGSDIAVDNLSCNGMQGDERIADILQSMSEAVRIDCSDIPDLAPILALACSQMDGVSALSGVRRLRIKESDRLCAMQELLAKLGVQNELSADGDTLFVHGPAKLRGGFEADARSDHRLVMFLAAAASIADAPITVQGVECVSKSWPGFLETYRMLGGMAK